MKVDLCAEQAQFSGKYTFAYAPACTFSVDEKFFPFNCTRSHCHKTTLLCDKHNIIRSHTTLFARSDKFFATIPPIYTTRQFSQAIRLWMMAILLLNLHIFFCLYVYISFAWCSDVIIDPHQIHAHTL